jgi:hypothetical protein
MIIYILVFLLIIACQDKGKNPIDQNYVIPESDVSYYDHLQPMFIGKCATRDGCHSALSGYSGNELIFGDKEIFMSHPVSRTGAKLVDLAIHKDNPQLSPLYLIVFEGYAGLERMPPFSSGIERLNANQISGIETWISEGAND